MKKYRSHKIVEAFKVIRVACAGAQTDALYGADGEREEVDCLSWLAKRVPAEHNPIGGYFVRYPDGYTSWSPAQAFEEGYAEVTPLEPAPEAPGPANLEGLRAALLEPRPIVRDADGWMDHPAFPIFDEGVDADLFLQAFGLESAFVGMDSDGDAPEPDEETGDYPVNQWNPKAPAYADGWVLVSIFGTENGPHALFVRDTEC